MMDAELFDKLVFSMKEMGHLTGDNQMDIAKLKELLDGYNNAVVMAEAEAFALRIASSPELPSLIARVEAAERLVATWREAAAGLRSRAANHSNGEYAAELHSHAGELENRADELDAALTTYDQLKTDINIEEKARG